jgi:hypothetical protein
MARKIIFLLILKSFLFAGFFEMDHLKIGFIKNIYGKKAVQRVHHIEDQFQKIEQEKFTYTKIYMVNNLINKLLYKKDKFHWKNDHKATFLEFVISGAGDSLDFAAAKYIMLVNLGFDQKRFKFFKTDIEGINKIKYDTKDYYILGYIPNKNSKEYVVLDCYSNKILPAFKKNMELKPSKITLAEKIEMVEDMLKINFIQKHQFLKVHKNRFANSEKRLKKFVNVKN